MIIPFASRRRILFPIRILMVLPVITMFLHRCNRRQLQSIFCIDNFVVFKTVALREIAYLYVSLHKAPQDELFPLTVFPRCGDLYVSMKRDHHS